MNSFLSRTSRLATGLALFRREKLGPKKKIDGHAFEPIGTFWYQSLQTPLPS